MRVRGMRDTIVGVAKELIKDKEQDLLQGNDDHEDDVLGLLGKAPFITWLVPNDITSCGLSQSKPT